MDGNNTHFNLRFSKEIIYQFINDYIQQYSQHKIVTESYEITLKKTNNTDFKIHTSDCSSSIIAELPIDFIFYRKAGLFSVEGEGAISVSIEIAYDIKENLDYTTKSTLLDYKWLQKPIVHLGTLTIPFETLSDYIIHFMKDNILSKIDTAIKENLNLKALIINQWQQYATDFLVYTNPKVYFNAILNKIISRHLKSDKTHLTLDIHFDIDIRFSDKPTGIIQDFNPVFVWDDNQPDNDCQRAEAVFSYNSIADILLKNIDGKDIGGKNIRLDSVHIRKTDILEIKANLREPIDGIITITGRPDFIQSTHSIDVKNVDVNVHANNVIYKLASPLIESAIRKKILENTPVDLTKLLDPYLKNIPVIQVLSNRISLLPSMSKTRVEAIEFGNNSLSFSIIIQNMEVNITA